MRSNPKDISSHYQEVKKTRSCLRLNLSCSYCMYPSTAASRFVYFSSSLLLRKKNNIIMYIPRSTDIIPTKSRNKIIRKRTGSLQQCDNDQGAHSVGLSIHSPPCLFVCKTNKANKTIMMMMMTLVIYLFRAMEFFSSHRTGNILFKFGFIRGQAMYSLGSIYTHNIAYLFSLSDADNSRVSCLVLLYNII